MNSELMFSSKTDEWETPNDVFESLDKEFHFTLDPCANELNHKCEKYYTKEQDGLNQNWHGETVFCNPPYGRKIGEWVKKCYLHGKTGNGIAVMLIPARTDTRWFHDYIYNKENVKVRFLKGRLKFGGCKNSAPFPSMVVVFDCSIENKLIRKLDDYLFEKYCIEGDGKIDDIVRNGGKKE